MAERKWTPAQRRAIDFRGKNLLLSAAAGSGKTATLTQRIIELLKDPDSGAEIRRMLIVTFTKAAAGELKQRIGDALSSAIAEDPGNKHIIKQLAALEGARISTIHSFFKTELEPYAVSLGLPPGFAVLDEAEAVVMQSEAMRDACDSFFEAEDEKLRSRFEGLVDCISDTRTESSIDTVLLGVRNSLASVGIDEKQIYANAEILRSNTDNICNTTYYDAVKKEMKEGAEHFAALFSSLETELSENEATAPYVAEAQRCIQAAADIGKMYSGSYRDIRAFLGSIEFKGLSPLKTSLQTDEYEYFKNVRSSFKAFVSKVHDSYFDLETDAVAEICLATAEKIEALAEIVARFNSIYGEKKRERGGVDYNDLEKFARDIFCTDDGEPTPAADAVGAKFDWVFIDEYQDTNAVQDMVFSAISRRCGRFMVGDVKQSIYTFRGAKPQIFTEYREKYERADDGEAVFMSENFRSDSGVINFSNLVSEYIFATGATPFEKSDRLIFAKNTDRALPAEICLVEKDAGGERYVKNAEAEYVADRIKAMLDGEYCEEGRRIQPRDVAILLRSGGASDDYVRALSERGIAASNDSGEDFFSRGEVLLVMCFLNAADNPLRDMYLAGAMKSPLGGFDLSELVRIRGREKDPLWYSVRRYAESGGDDALRTKCSSFAEKLNKWRSAAGELPADEILRLIISDTGLMRYKGDDTRSRADIARSVKVLISYACTVSGRGGGLHDLVIYLGSLMERRGTAPVSGDENRVSIMSVHKSKGLEYPVCFICECQHRFNTDDKDGRLIIGSKGEIALKLYDSEGLVRCDTPLRRALGEGLVRQSIEEEARVLYVAMTRARERLILTFKVKDADEEIENAMLRARQRVSAYSINRASSFAAWVIDAAARNPGDSSYIIKKISSLETSECSSVSVAEDDIHEESSERMRDFLSNSIDICDGKEYLRNIPAKLTVSKLRPDILNLSGDEKLSLDAGVAVSMPEKMPLPRFMGGDRRSAADAGTATHIYMQFCDWKRLYDGGAEAELGRLLSCGFISAENAALVRLDEIELFRRSNIIMRLMSAKEVLREKRFNAMLPACDFTTDLTLAEKLHRDGINITVQGVVDCIFTDSDGKTVLLDYKTDRLTEKELDDRHLAEKKLAARHSRQLLLYRDICERIYGRSFDGIYIYSLPMGDIVEIKDSHMTERKG